MEYYVYAYLREDGSPYYIGKGKGRRAWRKCSNDALHPPKDKSRIVILAHKLFEQEAFTLEIKLIKQFGRKDLGTGILRNQTHGGDGASGRIVPEQERLISSQRMSGSNNPMYGAYGDKNPMFGKRGKDSPLYGIRGNQHYNFGRKSARACCVGCKRDVAINALWQHHANKCFTV